MSVAKKMRRGAPVFGMAWDLDEDMLFHGGRSREEKRAIIEHERKRAVQMRQMREGELSSHSAAAALLPGQIQTPPLVPLGESGVALSTLAPTQQLEASAARQPQGDIVYRSIPTTAPMIASSEAFSRASPERSAATDDPPPRAVLEPHPLMDSTELDKDSYIVLKVERHVWNASEEDLELARTRYADSTDTSGKDDGVACAICFEKMQVDACVSLLCGHCFHKTCAQKSERHAMLEKGLYECPECREQVSHVGSILISKGEEVLRLDTALKPTRTATDMSAGIRPVDDEAGAPPEVTAGHEGQAVKHPKGAVSAKYMELSVDGGKQPKKSSDTAVADAGNGGESEEGGGERDEQGEQGGQVDDPQGLMKLLKTNLALKELLEEMMNVGPDDFRVGVLGQRGAASEDMSQGPWVAQPAALSKNQSVREQRLGWQPAVVSRTITVWEVKCKGLELMTTAVANELYEEELKIVQKRLYYKIGFCVMIVFKVLLLMVFLLTQADYNDD